MSNIVSELVLKTGLFGAGIKSAQNSLKSLSSSVMSAKGLITGAFGLISSSAVALGLKHAFDVGAELNNLSNATDTGVQDLVVLQRAFETCGIDADKLSPALGRLRRGIVEAAHGGGTADTFARLHVSLKSLGSMNATGQLQTIGAAIMRMKNPTDRTAAAMALFGKNGQQMLALFGNSGALNQAAEAVGEKAKILDKNSALFHDITEKLATIGIKLQGFFYGMAATVGPALEPVLNALSKLNFANLGKQIGDVVAFIITAFSSGQIGSIVGNSLIVSFGAAINFILSGLVGVAFAFGQLIVEAFKNAVLFFQIVTTANFWKGLGDSLMGIAQGFIAFLLDGVAMLLDHLEKIPGIGKHIGNAADNVRKEAEKIRDKGEKNRSKGEDLIGPAAQKIKQRFFDEMHNVGAAFKKGQAAAGNVIDTSSSQAALDASVGKVMAAVQANKKAADKFNAEHKPGQRGPAPAMIDDRKRKLGPAFAQSLFKLGGGGISVGVGGKDPILEENRRHTSLLQQIARNTALKTGGLTTGSLATFSL
jgi:hypothetical protein